MSKLKLVLCSVFTIWTLQLSATALAEKLSSAKLLLPYHPTIPVSYTLEVTESDASTCYRWYSSKPGVVSVEPLDPWSTDNIVCSQKALVISKSNNVARNMAVVYAENVQTRQVLKCHVVVEKVKTIMIDSKSRELYLEDSPEPFKVLAMDEEGNMFSTLGSLPFEWLLLADAASADASMSSTTVPSQILRLVRYADSPYEASEDISFLENSGARGYMVLLEGMQTGVAFISAKIKDPLYRDVSETHVKLRVVANVQLLPGEVYLMPLATARIRAYMFRQNRPSPLQLPSSQHTAFVGDSAVATFDEKTATVKAINFGATNITLIDKNIQIKDDYIPPSSFVYVEKPASLRMNIVQYPHISSPWVLEAGRDYEIQIDVLDRLGHVLILPDDFVLSCLLPSRFFEVKQHAKNGTIWHVKTKPDKVGEGVIPVSANWSFKSVKVLLEHAQDFVIYSPIVVHPKLFGLPLALFGPDVFVGYSLQVSGGSGQYIFMSSDNKIVTVDSTGLVRSVALEPGTAEIKVTDQRNNKHSAVSVVVVGDVAEVEFSPESKVEALIGTQLSLGIRANIIRGKEKIPLANCSVLKFALELTRISLQDSSEGDEQADVFKLIGLSKPQFDPQSNGLDCASVLVDTLRSGFSELKIRAPLPASVIISGYSSLRLDVNTDYGVSQVVTAIHTRVRLPILGGPLVWPSERETHLVTVEPMKDSPDFDFLFSWNSRSVEISAECQRYGDFDMLVTVGNVRSEKTSVYEKLQVRVSCPEPNSIQLSIPWGQDSAGPPCPASMDNSIPFPVVLNDIFPVVVTVFDINHRRFMNISSFELKWSFEKGLVACTHILANNKCADLTFNTRIRQNLMSLKTNSLGLESVQVELNGYQTQFGQHDEKLKVKPRISTSLALRIVEPARLSETDIVLFTIPDATKKIQVIDGSGFFQFNIPDRAFVNERIASTVQSDLQTLSVNPYGNGVFSVEVTDLCSRPGSQPSLVANFKVLSIDKLVVIGRRFIAIEETFNIGVIAMDASGQHHLPADLYGSISLKPVFAEDKISIVPTGFIGDIAIFSITGKTAGLAKLVFTASGVAGKQLLTSPEDYAIEVCYPVEISPSPRLVLMDGASYQLAIVGGPVSISPKPSVTFRFVSGNLNPDAVSLDKNSGLVYGQKIGDVKVEAVLYDSDPLAARLGKHSVVEILTQPLTIEVRHLTGIHLASPTVQLEANSLVPITVFGIKEAEEAKSKNFDFNPNGFGTADPPLSFSWSVSPNGPKIELLSPFFGPLYSRPLDEDFTVYFRSSTPGDFIISVQVSRPLQTNFKNLTASLPISVVLPFKIGRVEQPFIVSVGAELHLPISGSCPFGQPKYSLLSESNGTAGSIASVSLGPSNSFVGKTPGPSSFLARCSNSDFLSFSFDVKPHFSYITIQNVENQVALNLQSKLKGLPFGASISLEVDYLTQSGRKFDAVSGQLGCRLNRRDAVNFYLPSGVPRSVTADLSLSDSISVVSCESGPSFPLFLAVVVKPAVSPFSSSISVGDVVCFRHLFDEISTQTQNWVSSQPSNLFVDKKTGIAIALRPSQRESVFVDYGGFRASTALTIRQIAGIEFVPKEGQSIISNSPSNNSLVFDIYVTGALARHPKMMGQCPVNFSPPQTDFPLPIQCEISAPDAFYRLFSVSTFFDYAAPIIRYHCQVRFLGANFNQLHDIGISSYEEFAAMEFPLRLYASLTSDFNGDDERSSTEITFVPNVFISSTNLQLDPTTLSANLTVSASNRVFRSLVVQPSHSSFISVTGPTPIGGGQSGRFVYEISLAAHRKVPANLVDRLHLSVRVPFLNQEHQVSITLPGTYAPVSQRDGTPAHGESESLFSRFFGSTSPGIIVAYIVVAVLLLLITLQLTFRGGFFGQPSFVQTVYTYEDTPSPYRASPTPPLRRSPASATGSDLDAQLLTAFRASGRTPVRPPVSGPGSGSILTPGGSSQASRLWSTGYVPEGNLNGSYGAHSDSQR